MPMPQLHRIQAAEAEDGDILVQVVGEVEQTFEDAHGVLTVEVKREGYSEPDYQRFPDPTTPITVLREEES